jgi:hypothetical protein
MAEPVAQAELARLLGVSEQDVIEIARHARLPFSISTAIGLHIQRSDLALWQSAVRQPGVQKLIRIVRALRRGGA